MHKSKFLFKALPFAILVLAITLTGCAGNSSSSNNSFATGVVSTVTVTNSIQTSGNLSADQLAALTWGTSGLTDKVNVTVGQKVKTGDVLAILRADSVPADIVTAQSDLASAQRDLSDIQNSSASLAQAQVNVVAAVKALEVAQNNYDALSYPRASDALIKNTQAQIFQAQKTFALAAKAYLQVQNLADGDPAKTQAQLNMTNAQLKLNNLVATYNWYIAKPTQADYDSAKANLDLARANLDDARRKRDAVKQGSDPLAIAAAQAKVDAAKAKVNQMALIAPFDGEIISVRAVSGNSVSSGDIGVEIVNRNTLKIDTLIDETAVSTVSIGDAANVTMDSLPDTTLKGKVSAIDRIGSTVNGLVKYTVTISVEPTDQPLLFGATANITIITSAPHSMLAVPIAAIQTDSVGEYVVLVTADGNLQRIAVQSGDISGNLVTIKTTGALKEGDEVELGSSTSSSSSNRNNGGGGGIGVPFGGPGGG